MNILPMLLAFCLALASLSLLFVRDTKSFHLLERTSEAQQRIDRCVRNNLAEKSYRKVKAETLSKRTPSKKTESDKEPPFPSKRTFFPPLDNARWNLTPLFKSEESAKRQDFYEPLAELLRLLYKNKLLPQFEAGIEYKLLDALFKKGQTVEDLSELAELTPDEPTLHKLYYKMLKGTNQYSEKKGYPPLEDFVCLENHESMVSLSFASPPLLEALFGSQVKDQVLNKELQDWKSEKKYVFCSKEALHGFLEKHSERKALLNRWESSFDYSKRFIPRSTCGGKDTITGIAARRNLDVRH